MSLDFRKLRNPRGAGLCGVAVAGGGEGWFAGASFGAFNGTATIEALGGGGGGGGGGAS